MKPTAKQIELIKTIKKIVSSWRSTNDISSPTHQSDIAEEMQKLQDEDTDNEFSDNLNVLLTIENYLSTILSEIQNYYDRENKET